MTARATPNSRPDAVTAPTSDGLYRRRLKRVVDLLAGSVLLLACVPILVLTALAVGLSSGRPVLFRQTRVGLGGRPFTILKFRTMRTDAADALATLLASDPDAAREYAVYGSLRTDPRVAGRVGALLRRSSLDELPQLWNVVRGQMSLIGPRPLEPVLWSSIDPAVQRVRDRVRPGVTGLYQVSGRSDLNLRDMVALDTHLRPRLLTRARRDHRAANRLECPFRPWRALTSGLHSRGRVHVNAVGGAISVSTCPSGWGTPAFPGL